MNRNSASGPGALTPDGCSVELYKRLASGNEAEIIDRALAPGAEVLELGAGAGRVTRGLVAYGRVVTAIDYSAEMLAEIVGATKVRADIATLSLGHRYGGVVLGSYLFNVIEEDLRRAFLDTCARHVMENGSVLLECHAPRTLEGAKPGSIVTDANGIEISWREVIRAGRVLRGTVEYRAGTAVWTQTFATAVFQPDEIADQLTRSGLELRRHVKAAWYEAVSKR